MLRKQKAIPKFSSESAERKFWATHDSGDYLDWSKTGVVRLPHVKLSTQTISLRLPKNLMESIRLAANARDVPYQSLIKLWLQERVQQS